MAESRLVEPEHDDISEWVRIGLIFGLLIVDCVIIYQQVKDQPEIVAWRRKIGEAIAGPFRRAREIRRQEAHTVFEAMEIVTAEEEPSSE